MIIYITIHNSNKVIIKITYINIYIYNIYTYMYINKHMYVNDKCVIYSNIFIKLITNFITT